MLLHFWGTMVYQFRSVQRMIFIPGAYLHKTLVWLWYLSYIDLRDKPVQPNRVGAVRLLFREYSVFLSFIFSLLSSALLHWVLNCCECFKAVVDGLFIYACCLCVKVIFLPLFPSRPPICFFKFLLDMLWLVVSVTMHGNLNGSIVLLVIVCL